MLRPPYTTYDRLYVYHLDMDVLPDIDDPDLIGTWIEDNNAILFFHRPKEELVRDICRATGCSVIYQADLDYQEWEAGHEITAFSVDNVTVAPVWDPAPAQIRLDPSVIFGSGFHPTTRLCLETLLKYIAAPEISIQSALDLGCGTGLLSIAAAQQGVGTVTAIDHNPLACHVAEANARRNQVEDRLSVRRMDLRQERPDTRVDLVMANLYKGLLEEIFRDPAFWQAKLYILSGFIPAMEQDLLAALPVRDMVFLERRRVDRWCLWVLLKK